MASCRIEDSVRDWSGGVNSSLVLTFFVVTVCASLSYLIIFQDNGNSSLIIIQESQEPVGHQEIQSGHVRLYEQVSHSNYSEEDPLISFLGHVKNPCWFEARLQVRSLANESDLKCLPYYMLAGMPKSATTDLMDKITQHPQVVKARTKEPHWWTRKQFGQNGVSRTFGKYLNEFENITGILQRSCQQEGTGIDARSLCGSLIVGDASASTLWDSRNLMKELMPLLRGPDGENIWRRYSLNRLSELYPTLSRSAILQLGEYAALPFTNADVIHSLLPDLRVILIMREPVDRLYSDYLFFKGPKTSASLFDSLVDKTLHEFSECLKTKTDRMCAYGDFYWSKLVRLHVGLYSIYIKDWLAVFPRDQLLFLRTEDYKANPRRTLEKIFDHLGLEPLEEDAMRRVIQPRFLNKNKKRKWPMFNKTRTKLRNFYAKYNEQLSNLLGDDAFAWKELDSRVS